MSCGMVYGIELGMAHSVVWYGMCCCQHLLDHSWYCPIINHWPPIDINLQHSSLPFPAVSDGSRRRVPNFFDVSSKSSRIRSSSSNSISL